MNKFLKDGERIKEIKGSREGEGGGMHPTVVVVSEFVNDDVEDDDEDGDVDVGRRTLEEWLLR